jgi:hypothetical protein
MTAQHLWIRLKRRFAQAQVPAVSPARSDRTAEAARAGGLEILWRWGAGRQTADDH